MGFKSPRYTQTPNDLFDEIMIGLSEAQLKTLLYIIRRTLGYHIRKRPMRIASIQKGTGLGRTSVINALTDLAEMKLIDVQRKQGKISNVTLIIDDETRTDFVPPEEGQPVQILYPKEKENKLKKKDSSAAGAGDGIPNKKIVDDVLKKRRGSIAGARNLWYDAVKDVWGYTGAFNGEMQKMLRGESKDAAFKKTNIDPPMTPTELLEWAADYRSVKLKGMHDMDMLEKRMKIQSEITAWRDGDYGLGAADMLVNAPEPAPTQAANPMPDNILLFDESGQFSGYVEGEDDDGSKTND